MNAPEYEIDTKVSTEDYIVARHQQTGKHVIAFRGTNPTGKIKSGLLKGVHEPIMWPAILAGQEEHFQQHKIKEIAQRITRQIPVDSIEHRASACGLMTSLGRSSCLDAARARSRSSASKTDIWVS